MEIDDANIPFKPPISSSRVQGILTSRIDLQECCQLACNIYLLCDVLLLMLQNKNERIYENVRKNREINIPL